MKKLLHYHSKYRARRRNPTLSKLKGSFIPLMMSLILLTASIALIASINVTRFNIEMKPVSGIVHVASKLTRDSPMITIDDSNVEYAIIAPPTFTAGMEDLAEWHSKLGTRTKVYSLALAEAMAGDDQQERLHNFLVDLNSTSDHLKYVLLVGDHELIPSRRIYVGADTWHLDEYYYADSYYAGLESDWDTNGNGTYGEWGEEDWTPDIMVGRLPIDDPGEISGMVDKIINYRTDPQSGDWIKEMLIWTSVMVPPNGDDYDAYKDNSYELYNKLKKTVPSYINKINRQDYPELEGGTYNPANDNLSRSAVKNDFNRGAGLLTFGGQAYYDESAPPMDNALAHYSGLGTDITWSILYNYEDCDTVGNGVKTPFAFIASCDTLNFTEADDSNLERWNTQQVGGVIGQIGSSGRSWRGESSGGESRGNWWMTERFWDLFFEKKGKAAEAYFQMRYDYATEILPSFVEPNPTPIAHGIKCNLAGYNFLGDPALDIWFQKPKNLLNEEFHLWDGDHTLQMAIKDQNLNPVPDTRVTIMFNDQFATAVSDENGNISLDYQLSQGDSVTVSFLANNHRIREKTVIVEASPSDLEFNGQIELTSDTPAVGDILTITADIENTGDATAADVKCGFYLNEVHNDNLIDDLVDVGSIGVGLSEEAEVQWEVVSGVERIHVVIDPDNEIMESDEWNNRAYTSVDIKMADIILDPLSLLSYGGFNISTVTGTTISITVENPGEVVANNVQLNMYHDSIHPSNVIGEEYMLVLLGINGQATIELDLIPLAGHHQYFLVADSQDTTSEMNETNNVITFFIFGNQPPGIDLIGVSTINLEGNETYYTKDMTSRVYDPDSPVDSLYFTFQHDAPEGVVITVAELTLIMNLEPIFSGDFTINLTLSDGYNDISNIISVHKDPMDMPPVIETIPDRTYLVDDTVDITLSVDDEDTSGLTYKDNSPMFDITGSGRVNFLATSQYLGINKVTITVTDSKGNIASVSFNITIKEKYFDPIISGNQIFNITLGEPLSIQLEYNVHEDWSSDLNFSLEPGDHASVDSAGLITFEVTQGDMDGETEKAFTFTAKIEDGKGTGSAVFTINVKYTGSTSDDDDNGNGNGGNKNGGDPKGIKDYLWIIIALAVILLIVGITIPVVGAIKRKKREDQKLQEIIARRKQKTSLDRPAKGRVSKDQDDKGKDLSEEELTGKNDTIGSLGFYGDDLNDDGAAKLDIDDSWNEEELLFKNDNKDYDKEYEKLYGNK